MSEIDRIRRQVAELEDRIRKLEAMQRPVFVLQGTNTAGTYTFTPGTSTLDQVVVAMLKANMLSRR